MHLHKETTSGASGGGFDLKIIIYIAIISIAALMVIVLIICVARCYCSDNSVEDELVDDEEEEEEGGSPRESSKKRKRRKRSKKRKKMKASCSDILDEGEADAPVTPTSRPSLSSIGSSPTPVRQGSALRHESALNDAHLISKIRQNMTMKEKSNIIEKPSDVHAKYYAAQVPRKTKGSPSEQSSPRRSPSRTDSAASFSLKALVQAHNKEIKSVIQKRDSSRKSV